ncbi:hypothetical protein GYMLUDRAFT_35557 [Collybiopsis luxurians FD-317 M1]|nr:hypothetical protein GYMLUDRAFT_35557 [Collybiopsis luxurians FD-317 M1]
MKLFLYSIQPAAHLQWQDFMNLALEIFLGEEILGHMKMGKLGLDSMDDSRWETSPSTAPIVETMLSSPLDAPLSIIHHLIVVTLQRHSASCADIICVQICMMLMVLGSSSEETMRRLILFNSEYRWITHVLMFLTSDCPAINKNLDIVQAALDLGLFYLLWLMSGGPSTFGHILDCKFFLIMVRSQRIFLADYEYGKTLKQKYESLGIFRVLCRQLCSVMVYGQVYKRVASAIRKFGPDAFNKVPGLRSYGLRFGAGQRRLGP